MPGIALTGLASGLDTSSIVTQLIALENNKVIKVQMRQTTLQGHQDDLKAIKTQLDAFKSAATALGDASLWKPTQTTSTSDPTKLDVAVLGGAGIGGHSIQIDRLAASAQHGFTYTPSTTDGSIDLFYGTDPAAPGAGKVTIAIAAGAKASDIATAVNANEASPVYAAVVKDGADEHVVFSARKTGASSEFSIDASAMGSGGSMAEVTKYARQDPLTLNASYKLDGGASLSSETNIVENAVPGVRLTLKGVTASPATVTTTSPAIDKAGIGSKVKALVDAYNSVVTASRTQLTERNDPTSTTTSGLQKGVLFGDTGLNSMLSQLKDQMRQAVSGLGAIDPADPSSAPSLADLGITVPKSTGGVTTADAKDGKLVFDSSVLTKALDTDWTKVRDLFTGKGATKGISGLISDYVSGQTGTSGVLTGRITSDADGLKDFTSRIAVLNTRMASTQKRLEAQFAAMEKALTASQAQQSWLTGQIASLG